MCRSTVNTMTESMQSPNATKWRMWGGTKQAIRALKAEQEVRLTKAVRARLGPKAPQ